MLPYTLFDSCFLLGILKLGQHRSMICGGVLKNFHPCYNSQVVDMVKAGEAMSDAPKASVRPPCVCCLRVLKAGGQVISISGPPDAAFARSIGASWVLRMIIGVLSSGITAKAKRRHAKYSFLFMRANGDQLTEITSLIDDGIIRPVVDRVFPFASTKEAMAYVEAGRAKGKVVVSLR